MSICIFHYQKPLLNQQVAHIQEDVTSSIQMMNKNIVKTFNHLPVNCSMNLKIKDECLQLSGMLVQTAEEHLVFGTVTCPHLSNKFRRSREPIFCCVKDTLLMFTNWFLLILSKSDFTTMLSEGNN